MPTAKTTDITKQYSRIIFIQSRPQAMNDSDPFASPLLDKEQLDMLLEAGAPESVDMFKEILDLFEEESIAKFEEMSTAYEAGDYQTCGNAAHSLAGSSANIGGKEVWSRAKVIENLCKDGNGEQAGELLEGLRSTYDSTLKLLKDLTDSLA